MADLEEFIKSYYKSMHYTVLNDRELIIARKIPFFSRHILEKILIKLRHHIFKAFGTKEVFVTVALGKILKLDDQNGDYYYRYFYPSHNFLLHRKPIICTTLNAKRKILEAIDFDIDRYKLGPAQVGTNSAFLCFTNIEIRVTQRK